jgi:4'-phosphopantetheinyl transferase
LPIQFEKWVIPLADLRALVRGQVDLWWIRTGNARCQSWLSQPESILSDGERERHQRYVFEQHRDQFLVSRALLRHTLSRYSDRPPEDWQFQTNEFGKPEIVSNQNPSRLRFNMSHCDGLVLCGITISNDIGVDCENVDRQFNLEQLAGRVLSSRERDYLNSVPLTVQKRTFVRLWTLKEAYVKARGLGMALPLQKVSFDLCTMSRIKISFDHEIGDHSESWQFSQPELSEPFVAAIAVNLPRNEPFVTRIHEA